MNILIVSQAINQAYLKIIMNSFKENTSFEVITGSPIELNNKVNWIESPQYCAKDIKSRFISWYQFYKFVKKWVIKNKNRRFDLIFATSNPPMNAYIGNKLLKKKFRCPFVYMNWDLYPQIIERSMDYFLVKLICKLWHLKNNQLYPQVDRMLTIGNEMAEVMNRGLKNKIPITVIPIGTNTERIKPIEKKNNFFCEEYDLVNKFVILYSGKMGYGHNVLIMLEAARNLRDYEEIQFLFIGEGLGAQLVKEFIRKEKSTHVIQLPFQSNAVFPYSITSADLGIVSQEMEISDLSIPSRVYDMMAAGLCIVGVTGEKGDLRNLIKEEKIGCVLEKNSAEELSAIILELYHNRNQVNIHKKNARAVAVKKYNQEKISKNYKEVFYSLL